MGTESSPREANFKNCSASSSSIWHMTGLSKKLSSFLDTCITDAWKPGPMVWYVLITHSENLPIRRLYISPGDQGRIYGQAENPQINLQTFYILSWPVTFTEQNFGISLNSELFISCFLSLWIWMSLTTPLCLCFSIKVFIWVFITSQLAWLWPPSFNLATMLLLTGTKKQGNINFILLDIAVINALKIS